MTDYSILKTKKKFCEVHSYWAKAVYRKLWHSTLGCQIALWILEGKKMPFTDRFPQYRGIEKYELIK